MTRPYQEPIDRKNPTLVLFLVDQSASMSEPSGIQPNVSKAQFVAETVNRLISSLLFRCSLGTEISDRFHIGLVGYHGSVHTGFGGTLHEQVAVPVSQLGNNLLRVEIQGKKVDDGAGGLIEHKVRVPIWVEPVAQGRRKMREALEVAKDAVAQFVADYPASFPPIVINFTDGLPTDAERPDFSDVEEVAHALRSIANDHGSQTLLLNVRLTSSERAALLFPSSEEEVSDRLSKLLFRMSSTLPEAMCSAVNSKRELELAVGARGFASQADAASILQLLNLDIGTKAARNYDGQPPGQVADKGGRDTAKPAVPKPAVPIDENVQFTVYRPQAIQPAKWYPLLVYAHLDALPESHKDEVDPIKVVQADAAKTLGSQLDSFSNTTQDSSHAVPREGELTFVPEMQGAVFNPARQTIRWMESVHKVEFRMASAPQYDGQHLRGRLSVFLGAILMAEVALRIKVDRSAHDDVDRAPQETVTFPRYRKIFASYSHRDLAIVEQFEKFVEPLGDRYLRDWRELRSGEQWNDRLLQMIDEADVFQLFWSRNSMQSKYVRQEWEHALKLKHKGPHLIRPTYWEEPFPESPTDGLPPDELLRIHFTKIGVTSKTPGSPNLGSWSPASEKRPADVANASADEKRLTQDASALRQASARENLRHIARELQEAHAAFDLVRSREIQAAWNSITGVAQLPGTDPLFHEVEPAFNWLASEDKKCRLDHERREAIALLERALDLNASRFELERCYNQVERTGAVPPELAERTELRIRSVETRQKSRRALNVFVSVVLVCCMAGLVFWFIGARNRALEFRQQVLGLQQLIKEENLTAAEQYLSNLKLTAPAILDSPEIKELIRDLQRLKDKKEAGIEDVPSDRQDAP